VNVHDVMTADPVVIFSNASLSEALDKMMTASCHHLPVLSTEKHLIGVLSFHDCERALGYSIVGTVHPLELSLADRVTVSKAMTPAPIVVEPDETAAYAAQLMVNHYIGCLPVMRGETLIGIVTRSDLLTAFIALSQKVGQYQ